MRVVKSEQIFLSMKEAKIFEDMGHILEELKKECESPDIVLLINHTQEALNDLWEEIEDID